jgi:hypothetical protein
MELLGDFLRRNKVPKRLFNGLLSGKTIKNNGHTYDLEITVETDESNTQSFIGAGTFNMVFELPKDEILKVVLFSGDYAADSTDNPERFIRLMREQPYTEKTDTAYRLTSCTITANLKIDDTAYQTTITQQAAIAPKEEVKRIALYKLVIFFALNFVCTGRIPFDFFIAGNTSIDGNIIDPTYSSKVRPDSPGGIKANNAFNRAFTEKFFLEFDQNVVQDQGTIITAMAFILAAKGLNLEEILEYRFPKQTLKETEEKSELNSTPFKDIALQLTLPDSLLVNFLRDPEALFKPSEYLDTEEQAIALKQIFNNVANALVAVTKLQQTAETQRLALIEHEHEPEVAIPKIVSAADFFATAKENNPPPANASKP